MTNANHRPASLGIRITVSLTVWCLTVALWACQTGDKRDARNTVRSGRVDRAAVYAVYHRGLRAEFQGDREAAIRAYQEAAALAPTSAHIHIRLAELLLTAGKPEEAVQVLVPLLERRPDAAEAHLTLGHAYERAGQYAEALAQFTATTELDPRNIAAWKRMTAIYLSIHDDRNAARCLEQLAHLDREFTYYHRRELARCYLRLQEYQKAADHLAAFVKMVDDADAWYDLGRARIGLGQYVQAREAFQEALALSPNSYPAHQALADLAYQAGKYAEALQYYHKAFNLASEANVLNLPALKRMGLIAYATHAYEQAQQFLLWYTQRVPDDTETVARLARCYELLGQYAEGTAALEGLCVQHPDSVPLAVALSHLYLRWDKPERSLAALERIRSSTEPDLTVRQRAVAEGAAGRAYAEAGRLNEATQALWKAIEIDPAYSQSYIDLAIILADAKRPAEGIAVLRRMLESPQVRVDDTVRAGAYGTLGRLHAAAKEYESARDALRKAMDLDPTDAENPLALAYVLMQLEAYDETIRTLRDVMAAGKVRPATEIAADYHYYIARALTRKKEYAAAADEVRKALPGVPVQYSLGLRLQLAVALAEARKPTEAIVEAETLVKDFPENPEALNLLGYLYAEANINLSTAEKLIRKALEMAPDDGNVIDSLGWVYYQQQQYEKAVVELERAAELTGGDPIVRDHLGDAYQALGRLEDAVREWERAIEAGSDQAGSIRDKIDNARRLMKQQSSRTEP